MTGRRVGAGLHVVIVLARWVVGLVIAVMARLMVQRRDVIGTAIRTSGTIVHFAVHIIGHMRQGIARLPRKREQANEQNEQEFPQQVMSRLISPTVCCPHAPLSTHQIVMRQ